MHQFYPVIQHVSRELRLLFVLLVSLLLFPGVQAQGDDTLDPYNTVEAEAFDQEFGVQLGNAGDKVAFIEYGDYLVFRDVAFGDERPYNGIVRASSNTSGGTIEFRRGSIVGPLFATAEITNTGGWNTFEDFEIALTSEFSNNGGSALNTVDLYLIFVGGDGFLFDVDNFVFSDTSEVTITDLTITNCPTEPILVGELYDFDVEILPVNTTNKFVAFTASDAISVDYISGEFLTQEPGTYTVSATSFSDGSFSDRCTFEVTDGGQAAFNGPHTVPGTIEAEFYDVGGPVVAYQDDNRKEGNLGFRPDDFVDVGSKSNASNGLSVGWTADGEFLEYTLESLTNGVYDITLTYAAGGSTVPGSVLLSLDSEPRVRFGELVPTGGWNVFATTTEEGVFLSNGSVLRLAFEGGGFDLDKISFVPTSSNAKSKADGHIDARPAALDVYPNPSGDGRFWLSAPEATLLRVTDMNGRELLRRQTNEGKVMLDLSAFPAGMYLLSDGERNVKLIRQ